jgi:hypothetical protein
VPRPQRFGNDDVEGLTDGLGGSEAEDALRAAVPEANYPRLVGIDDGVGCVPNEAVAEVTEPGE